ncbi:golgi phosphoprotein 3 [Nematocida ausubeli]|uniref:Golgi phosphoprotein 3 n=1 Tax=Nematocida ausubeli (strain ATCC PRA-371 / ERTm2) TaxID=1913371 RepID=A0A086J4G2_NEMA1|nr:uncharacterized protein NESG_00102 [Nematocida ausubeli]KAI5132452.1 golgi phosphoprotein 3 [Nematocida ausubeli]KAI5132778.1 golgi phosphoprotein 3 [Nematocida ausubeli]KAI5147900.1 golgi phosphoprotein 3 [Nematocida ausubeli]KAI5162066.1 golgi phosphoprotein 3 [Nematocida ausubeli]KFG27030.1 hypothetical protein NESG_00102 [Nematocida ausubeli]
MDDFSPRRRDVKQENAFSSLKRMKTDLNLSEILVIFTTTVAQMSIPGLYDPVSITLRALLLSELVLCGGIAIDKDDIIVARDTYMPLDSIHDEVHGNIRKAVHPKSVSTWLKLLNGESYSIKKDKYHVRNTRKRIGKCLVEKKILKRSKSKTREFINLVANRGQVVSNEEVAFKGVKSKIILDLTAYLTGESQYEDRDILKLDIIVCALVFCCFIDDLYLTLSPRASGIAQKKVGEIISKYKSLFVDTERSTEWGIHSIMRAYLKMSVGI